MILYIDYGTYFQNSRTWSSKKIRDNIIMILYIDYEIFSKFSNAKQ